MKYSVIIPIFDEAQTLKTLLKEIELLRSEKIEFIIINDGSTDNTRKILESHKSSKITFTTNPINSGKGYAIKIGIDIASGEHLILFDGDQELDIEELPELIKIYEQTNDILIGKRWNLYDINDFSINTIGNHIINYLFNLLYNCKLNDVLCCVKIIPKDVLKSLEIKSNGFSIEIETMSKIIKKKLGVKEALINYKRRSLDEGKKFKFIHGWKIYILCFM